MIDDTNLLVYFMMIMGLDTLQVVLDASAFFTMPFGELRLIMPIQ